MTTGLPANQAVALVEDVIKAGRPANDLLELPSEVQRGMAQGATPAGAAEGLARGEGHGRPVRPPHAPPGREQPRKP